MPMRYDAYPAPTNPLIPTQPNVSGGATRGWGQTRPGENYAQVEGPGNPSWEARNPQYNPASQNYTPWEPSGMGINPVVSVNPSYPRYPAPPPSPSPNNVPNTGVGTSAPTTQAEFNALQANSGRNQLLNLYATAGKSPLEGFGTWTSADDQLLALRDSGAPLTSAQTSRLLKMSGAKNDAIDAQYGSWDGYNEALASGEGGYTVGGKYIPAPGQPDYTQVRRPDPPPRIAPPAPPIPLPPSVQPFTPPPVASPVTPPQTLPVIDPYSSEISPQQTALNTQIGTQMPGGPPMLGQPPQMGAGKGGAPSYGGYNLGFPPQYGGYSPQYGGFSPQYGGFSPVNAFPAYGRYAAPPPPPSPTQYGGQSPGKGGAMPSYGSSTPYGKGGAATPDPVATPETPVPETTGGMDRYSGRFSGY